MYRACVEDGSCMGDGLGTPWWEGDPQPAYASSCNFARDARSHHPLNCVAWKPSRDFCAWLGGDLPTEAQWEYAAGGRHGLAYPWGEDRASCTTAVMKVSSNGCGLDSTSPVCSRGEGNTREGVCDMAGNVFEWMRDWYDSRYYAYARSQDPPGPSAGKSRVVRGGGWLTDAPTLEVTRRAALEPESRYHGLGARCVRPLY